VQYGLLSKEGDHKRVFSVIEVELAFLYDFFYTKYSALFVKTLQRKLGQYSLLESFNHNPSKLLYNRWTT
jgi:hypothetical protein